MRAPFSAFRAVLWVFAGTLGCGGGGTADSDIGDGTADADATEGTDASAGDTGETPEVAETTAPDDVAEVEVTAAPILASTRVGAAGGVVTWTGGRLEIPAGALGADTQIQVRGPLPEPATGLVLYSPVLGFEPEGLRFELPATLVLAVPEAANEPTIFWSLAAEPGAYEQRPTERVAAGAALEAKTAVYHFSTVYMCDPNVPGTSGWFCCAPKNPAQHTSADCIQWTSANGTTCDATICDLTQGACPPPPPPHCADCTTYAAAPAFASTFAAAHTSFGADTCANLQATGAPPISAEPADPAYPTLLGEWCGFQVALADQCGGSAGCPDPKALCMDCTNPTYSSDPDFTIAAQSGVGTYFGLTCAELFAQNVPAPSTPPDTVAFKTEIGRWCAMQEALNLHQCPAGPSSFAPVCGPGLCQVLTTPCPTPPDPCAPCSDPAVLADPQYAVAAHAGLQAYTPMACTELATQNVPAPSAPPNTPAHATELGRWCAFQQALTTNACATGSGTIGPTCDPHLCNGTPGSCP